MITMAFGLAAGLFCMKILWNLVVPYALAVRAYKERDVPSKGVSLMPMVDVVLLAACVALAFITRATWPWSPGGVLILGGGALIGSYLHLILVGGIAGWAAHALRRRAMKRH